MRLVVGGTGGSEEVEEVLEVRRFATVETYLRNTGKEFGIWDGLNFASPSDSLDTVEGTRHAGNGGRMMMRERGREERRRRRKGCGMCNLL